VKNKHGLKVGSTSESENTGKKQEKLLLGVLLIPISMGFHESFIDIKYTDITLY
jgi:hypothetical protein